MRLPSRRPCRRRRPMTAIEPLETRTLFHLELIAEIPNVAVGPGTPQSEINLGNHFDNEEINGTIVRFQTDLGEVDMEMFDGGAPATVSNFLGYVTRGEYNNTIFHRAIPQFVVQGGGYSASTVTQLIPPHIPTLAPIVNEFSTARSNVRATVAMAKEPDNPNSATSEFFFNLEDNSGTPPFGLDFQNGGFTVFARVINNTMPVVDAMAGLQTFDPPAVPFEDLPLRGVPPATADNVVRLNTAMVIEEAGLFTYTVQSSDPALVTPVVENGILRLNYGAGMTGLADITITATDVDGTTATDTFTAGVGALDVAIGDNAARQATFTDADGTTATISLKGGSGVLRFSGSNLSQTVGRAGAQVNGQITDLAVTLTGSGTGGALAVKASGGDGLITFSGLTADFGLKSIAAKQVNLAGNLTVAGNVGKADFADVSNSIMTFGGSGGSLALSLRDADQVEINSQIPIKSLKAASFVGGGGPDIGTISAPGLGSVNVTGNFFQRLNIAGSLGTTKIGGQAGTFLPWSVSGAAGKVTLGSVADGFIADFLGSVSGLTVNGNLTGDVSAGVLKSLTVKGDMTSSNLLLSGPGVSLGRATVSGAITNSRIQATSGIGSVTANSINASTIYAGVNTDGGILPFSLTDFSDGPSEIKSVTVKSSGGAPSFVNSNIAARNVGRLNLGTIQVGNAGVPFGVAGDNIASISGTGNGPLRFSRLDDTSDTTAQQDFEIRVF